MQTPENGKGISWQSGAQLQRHFKVLANCQHNKLLISYVSLPDSVGRDVEDAVLAGDGDVDHRLHGGAVEVVVVLHRVGSYVRLADQIL